MSAITSFIGARIKQEVSISEFFSDFMAQFNPSMDISFKDYFLELSAKENRGQFIVPHDKLFEYGITTSNRSSAAKEKIEKAELVEGQDFTLQRALQRGIRGATTSNHYLLTPQGFKQLLLGASRHQSHDIDVNIYKRYYIALEDCFCYYSEYQELRAAKYSTKSKKLKTTQDALLDRLDKIIGQNDNLIKKGEETNAKLDEAKDERKNILGKFDTVVDMLKQKSIESTMNPVDSKLHHNFVVMGYEFTDPEKGKGRKLALIAGQEVHVRKTMREKFNDQAHNWTVQIGMHYNANPIDLRNNIAVRAKEHVKKIIAEKNAQYIHDAAVENERIKDEIVEFNRTRAKNIPKRVFSKEKISTRKISCKDIPIVWNKMSAAIFENEFIDYDDMLELVRQTNGDTQKSPFASDDEPSDSETTASLEEHYDE